MNEAHQHDWQPIPLAQARYSCACGEEGMRLRDGSIRLLREVSRKHVKAFVEQCSNVVAVRSDRYSGIVERLPTLDETERRKWRR